MLERVESAAKADPLLPEMLGVQSLQRLQSLKMGAAPPSSEEGGDGRAGQRRWCDQKRDKRGKKGNRLYRCGKEIKSGQWYHACLACGGFDVCAACGERQYGFKDWGKNAVRVGVSGTE